MLDPTFHFVFSTLSACEGDALARLRFRDLVQEWMDTRDLTEPEAIVAISEHSSSKPFWFSNTIEVCIIQYRRMRTSGLIPEPICCPRHDQSPEQDFAGSNSRLRSSVTLAENSAFTNVLVTGPPNSDSRLQPPDSRFTTPASKLLPDPDPDLMATG